jgi:hypothetical protein
MHTFLGLHQINNVTNNFHDGSHINFIIGARVGSPWRDCTNLPNRKEHILSKKCWMLWKHVQILFIDTDYMLYIIYVLTYAMCSLLSILSQVVEQLLACSVFICMYYGSLRPTLHGLHDHLHFALDRPNPFALPLVYLIFGRPLGLVKQRLLH